MTISDSSLYELIVILPHVIIKTSYSVFSTVVRSRGDLSCNIAQVLVMMSRMVLLAI